MIKHLSTYQHIIEHETTWLIKRCAFWRLTSCQSIFSSPKKYNCANYHSNQSSYQAGYTLIELILYIGLIGVILTTLTGFAWNMMTLQAKSRRSAELTHIMSNVTTRIQSDLRQATNVATASGQLSLVMSDSARNPTVYSVVNGQIRLGQGFSGNCPTSSPCPLTPTWLSVSPFTFGSFVTSISRHVRITISAQSQADRPEWDVAQIYTISTQLRTP